MVDMKDTAVLTGRIIKGIGGFYYVDAASILYECKARGVFRKDDIKPLPGDICDIEVLDQDKRTAVITSIHDRCGYLIRPAVANVDQLLLVVAAKSPDPSFGVIDRVLINMELTSVETII